MALWGANGAGKTTLIRCVLGLIACSGSVTIGATLARLEARCMFDEIIRRLSDIEICGPVVRMHSNLVNGYKQMPVRFRVR